MWTKLEEYTDQQKEELVFFLDKVKEAYNCKEVDIPFLIRKHKLTYRYIDHRFTILKKNQIMIQILPNKKNHALSN